MKQMWDKKKLEEMIQAESPQITVDSALSDTSENPVQNKVIYTALAGKQDSLPDTLEQEGKFLGIDESGNLAWGDPDKPLYLHKLEVGGGSNGGMVLIINQESTPFTTSTLSAYLYSKGFTSNLLPYPASGPIGPFKTDYLANICGVFSANGTTFSVTTKSVLSLTINDGAIVITRSTGSSNINYEGSLTSDTVIAI